MKASDLIHDWNEGNFSLVRDEHEHPHPVWFEDETLRDGLQSPSVRHPTTNQKIDFMRYVNSLNIQKMNLGLPGAGAMHLDGIERMLQVISTEGLEIRPGCTVRTLTDEIDIVVDLAAKYDVSIQVNTFLATSPIRQFTDGQQIDNLLNTLERAVEHAQDHDLPVMFVTEDTTRSKPEHIKEMYLKALEMGVRRLCNCDTAGHAIPCGTKSLLGYLQDEVITESGVPRREVELAWHGHQDRGLGVANNLAAWEAGIDVIHGTALGIGERSGNAPLDLTMVNLKLLGAINNDLSMLSMYVEKAQEYLGVRPPRNYPVFGEDAFETGTGIHASAIVKAQNKGNHWLADRVYSSVPATDVGMEQKIRIGPMSGRSNVNYWLTKHGIEPKQELIAHILDTAKQASKLLDDSEIMMLVNDWLHEKERLLA